MKVILKREELDKKFGGKIGFYKIDREVGSMRSYYFFKELPDVFEVEVEPLTCKHGNDSACKICNAIQAGYPDFSGSPVCEHEWVIPSDFSRTLRCVKCFTHGPRFVPQIKKKLLAPALYKDRFGWAITSKLYDETLQMFGVDKVIWPAPFNPQTGFYEIEEE